MKAKGSAYGAVTVLNATATGRGCALAVQSGMEATWDWTGDTFVWESTGIDSRVARSVYDLLRHHYDAPAGAVASTTTAAPPARGLKTSSGAAAALLRAGLKGLGEDISDMRLATLAVEASVAAGVTLTGAFDDQVATVFGGCHVTDNAAGRILAAIPVTSWEVAVWIPDHDLPKERVAAVDTSPIRSEVEEAEALLWRGDLPAAMTKNGAAFTRLYADAGLPVSYQPVETALDAGALGAGLSGTGPAVAALFTRKVDLGDVRGGTWAWTRTIGRAT